MELTQIWIYPIKSLGGIRLQKSKLDQFGLKYDRRWVLVDNDNQFISQRSFPRLNRFSVSIADDSMSVEHQVSGKSISFDVTTCNTTAINVSIWDDECIGFEVSQEVSEWFTKELGVECRLVHFPDNTKRIVDAEYTTKEELTSFTDGFPYLLLSEESLEDLNDRLEVAINMKRFRPNLVYKGSGLAFHEDTLDFFKLGECEFRAVKPCSRCIITTIDPQTSKLGKEPLATLAKYRLKNNNVYFGQNLLRVSGNQVNVGDRLEPTL